MYREMVFQDAVVPKMSVCVTFGASRIGANSRNVCALLEYATFSTISATAVREMTVCVTFGAPHFGFPVATWRRPVVDHVGGVAREGVFSAMGVFLFLLVGGVCCIWPSKCAMGFCCTLQCDIVVVAVLQIVG